MHVRAQEGKSSMDIGMILALSGRNVEKQLKRPWGVFNVQTRVQRWFAHQILDASFMKNGRFPGDSVRTYWSKSREKRRTAS